MSKSNSAQHTAPTLEEFADEADSVVQMVIRTFGNRGNPPKLLEAYACIVMCEQLHAQYEAMGAAAIAKAGGAA